MREASNQRRKARISATLATVAATLLLVAPSAGAQDRDPGVDQYVESLPTSRGDRAPSASRDPKNAALPRDVRAGLARRGQRPRGQSNGDGDARPRARRRADDERREADDGGGAAARLGDFAPGRDAPVGSPNALSSAAETVTDAGGLVWLLLGLGVVTIMAVSRALVHQRRAQD